MNLLITNLELMQATMEIMCVTFCLICIVILSLNYKSKLTVTIRQMLEVDAIVLFFDACAYIFRGNLDPVSINMTRISNFIVFTAELILVYFTVRLSYVLLEICGVEISKATLDIAGILTVATFLIIFSNLFTGNMYFFDEANYYHRNTGWYVFVICTLVIMGMAVGVVLSKRDRLDKRIVYSAALYILFPFVATVVQYFVYGISLSNMSTMASLVVVMFININAIAQYEEKSMGDYQKSKNTIGMMFMILMLVVTMSASILFFVRTVQRVAKETSTENSETIFYMVHNSIENDFIRPITVSDTIAQDVSLRALFDPEVTDPDEDITDGVKIILKSIQKAFGYKIMFAVSEETGNFYTFDGLSRTIDKHSEDSDDSWYMEFINSDQVYELNVDKDKDRELALSIFVNRSILSDDGRLIGVCGAGIDMSDLCEKIADFEEKYNIEINMVNEDGLVQVSSDISHVENEYLDNSYFEKVGSEEAYYEGDDESCRLTMFMPDLGWYLIITDNNPNKINVTRIVAPCILIFLVGIIIMSVVFWALFEREKIAVQELDRSRVLSSTDKLTGLGNRRAYDSYCDRIITERREKEIILAMMDLNGLKTVNDNLGHEAGDELIIGAVECISKAFEKLGNVYRIGGDEFVAILECDKETCLEAEKKLEELLAGWSGEKVKEASVAVGWVAGSDYPGESIDELECKADEIMYKRKAEYYIKSGKDRRRV